MEVQRRALLAYAAAGLGVTLGGSLLTRADSVPSLLESTSGGADTLDAAEEAIYAVGLGHMRPDTDPDDMMAAAAGVVRDVYPLRKGTAPAVLARVLYIESIAAATMASIYGHARQWHLARPLFTAARESAERSATLGEVRAPGALMVTNALVGKVVLYMHPTHTRGALAMAEAAASPPEAPRPFPCLVEVAEAATHPSIGQGPPPGAALAVSLVARSHAARGDHRRALDQLEAAAALVDDPGYFAAPFLERVVPVDGAMSLFGYGTRAHHFTTAEVMAAAGDYDATMDAVTAYLASPDPVSNTSAATSRLLEARALMNSGHVNEGAELAHHILVDLPIGHRNPHVVGRGLDLLALARRQVSDQSTGPVAHFAAYLSRISAPMSSAVV